MKAVSVLWLVLSIGACATTMGAQGPTMDPNYCESDADCPGRHCRSNQCVADPIDVGTIPPPVSLECAKDSDCGVHGSCQSGECAYAAPPDTGNAGSPCMSGANCVGGTCNGPDCQ